MEPYKEGVHHTAQVHPSVIVGKGAYIGPYCVIGYPAESIDVFGDYEGRVVIGPGAIMTGFVTIDSGIHTATQVGQGCFIMKHCHIGHDAMLAQEVRMAPGAKVGGHAIIGKRAYLGMNSTVVNRGIVGRYAMVGAGAVVVKKYPAADCHIYVGNPAERKGRNTEGIRYWLNREPENPDGLFIRKPYIPGKGGVRQAIDKWQGKSIDGKL